MALHIASEAPEDTLGFISRADLRYACTQLLERWQSTDGGDLNIKLRGEKDEAYLAISRPLRRLQTFSKQNQDTSESDADELKGIEEGDEAAVYHSATAPTVEYNIIYSPSYRVPVLYFFLHDLPSTIPVGGVKGIEAVYKYLVSSHQHEAIRQVGILGGIGMTNHPLTDVPCFWVHPCNTAKAMADIIWSPKPGISSLDYLMLWIGLVGSTVGLYLLKELAMQHESQVRSAQRAIVSWNGNH